MFCALNGATFNPLRRSHAQSAVASQLLPLFDEVPRTEIAFMPPSDSARYKSRQVLARAGCSAFRS